MAGIISTGLMIEYLNINPFADGGNTNIAKHIHESKWLHMSVHNYIGVYALGVIVGYATVNKIIIRSNITSLAIWVIISIPYNLLFYIPAYWRSHERGSHVEELLFGSLQRTVYSAAVSWFLYRMITVDSILSKFFSWKQFTPFGRMFFTLFLGMGYMIHWDTSVVRQPISWNYYSLAMRSTYTAFYGIILGYIMHLVFEAPYMSLMKTLMNANMPKSKTQ